MIRSTKMDTNTIAKIAASDMVPPPSLHNGQQMMPTSPRSTGYSERAL
jgi:hypothetical protein